MNHSQSNTKGIWALTAIIVLLGGGAVFAHYYNPPITPAEDTSQTASTTTTHVATVPGTEDWLTYNASDYSFKHPKDFMIDESFDLPHIVVPVKSYFHTILTNEAYLIAYPPASECPESQGEQFSATTTLKTVDGTQLSRVGWSGVGAGQLYVGADYSVVKDGKCYQVTLYTHSANGAGFYFNNKDQIKRTDAQQAADMKAFLALIDKSLSTFQFGGKQ
jgi:hypothetical protein